MFVSIVIVNYNYADYLGQAIESALGQTYPHIEVIVIDDGSTDGSRQLIERYGDMIQPYFKSNSGQVASTNIGKDLAKGDVIVFLDSDDVLYHDAVERHVTMLEDPAVIKSQGMLEATDSHLNKSGSLIPRSLSAPVNALEVFHRFGPTAYNAAFTSGNAWKRSVLDRVFPLPDEKLRIIGPDGYLSAVDLLFGKIATVEQPLGLYRIHGENIGPSGYEFDVQFLRSRLIAFQRRLDFAEVWGLKLGLEANKKRWLQSAGWAFTLSRYALTKLDPTPGESVSLSELISSPFRRSSGSLTRSIFLAAMLATIGLLPRDPGLYLASMMLDRAWGRSALKSSNKLKEVVSA